MFSKLTDKDGFSSPMAYHWGRAVEAAQAERLAGKLKF